MRLTKLSIPEVVITIGLLAFSVGSVFAGSLYAFDFNNIEKSNFTRWVPAIIRDIGAIATLFTMIITGLWSIRKKTRNIKHFLLFAVGTGICILFAYMNYSVHIKMKSMHTMLFKVDVISKLEKTLNREKLSLEGRALAEKMLAKEQYFQNNKLVPYITESGESLTFVPSEEDISYRDKYIETNKILKWTIATTRNGTVLWISVLVTGFFVGILTPRHGESQGPNNSI